VSIPPALQELIDFFEHLPEPDRRDSLISMAESVEAYAPRPGQSYAVEEVRKDPECSDIVGIFLQQEGGGHVHFAVTFGPKVQTLTRALAAILCRGLNGCTAAEIRAISPDFIPRIVGAELVRLRSQTVYYILHRMKQAAENAILTT
jgi:cysteine desulfuration protein SufE